MNTTTKYLFCLILTIFLVNITVSGTLNSAEKGNVSASIDADCKRKVVSFTVPAMTTANNFNFILNSSWLPCEGPSTPTRIGFKIYGPTGTTLYYFVRYYNNTSEDLVGDLSTLTITGPATYSVEVTDGGIQTKVILTYDLVSTRAPGLNGLSPSYGFSDHPVAQNWNDKGMMYLIDGNIEEAIKCFTEAINHDPNFILAYSNRGWAYNMAGMFTEALTDFNKGITLADLSDPILPWLYQNRGWAKNGLERFSEAISDLNRAIELDPTLAWAYHNRGWAYIGTGQYELAISDCNKAISLDPSMAWAYNNRGWAYFEMERFDDALKDFSTACSMGLAVGCSHYNELKKGMNQ